MTEPIEAPPTYDPYELIDDIAAILRARGIQAQIPDGSLGEAVAGAGRLLRAYGVQPAIHPVIAAMRSTALTWGESQDNH